MNPSRLSCHALASCAAFCVASLLLAPVAHSAEPAQLLAAYAALAGTAPAAARGKELFTQRHGREWSCASCHGATPVSAGQHATTGKTIAPMAPAFNPQRFTDAARVEEWFRRNCNDVIGRDCTAAEKADVLSSLLTLEP